jgi:hypothetical protein
MKCWEIKLSTKSWIIQIILFWQMFESLFLQFAETWQKITWKGPFPLILTIQKKKKINALTKMVIKNTLWIILCISKQDSRSLSWLCIRKTTICYLRLKTIYRLVNTIRHSWLWTATNSITSPSPLWSRSASLSTRLTRFKTQVRPLSWCQKIIRVCTSLQ